MLGGPGSFYWQGERTQECGRIWCLREYSVSSNQVLIWTNQKIIYSASCITEGNWSVSKVIGWCNPPDLSVLPSGQLISATTEEIVKAYYPSYFLLAVNGQIQTRQAQGNYDDSYLGESALELKNYWIIMCPNPNNSGAYLLNLASVFCLALLYTCKQLNSLSKFVSYFMSLQICSSAAYFISRVQRNRKIYFPLRIISE